MTVSAAALGFIIGLEEAALRRPQSQALSCHCGNLEPFGRSLKFTGDLCITESKQVAPYRLVFTDP